MTCSIRKFKMKDVEKVLSIIISYRVQHHKINVDETIIENTRKVLLSMLKHKDSFVFIGEIDSKVIGYMVVHLCPFPLLGSHEMYITDLVIDPDYRNQGNGKCFINKAIEFGRSINCKRLMLNNNKISESYLRSFYRKCKFEERNGFANFVYNLL